MVRVSAKPIEGEEATLPSISVDTHLHHMTYYELPNYVLVIATNEQKREYRILKLYKVNEPKLEYVFDTHTYTNEQVGQMVKSLKVPSGKMGEAKGIIGFIRFLKGYYVIFITKSAKSGQIGPHDIYEIGDTTVVSLCESAEVTAASLQYYINQRSKMDYDEKQELDHTSHNQKSVSNAASGSHLFESFSNILRNDEEKYLSLFKSYDLKRYFYYSHSYDLTNTLQVNMTRAHRVSEARKTAQAHEAMRTKCEKKGSLLLTRKCHRISSSYPSERLQQEQHSTKQPHQQTNKANRFQQIPYLNDISPIPPRRRKFLWNDYLLGPTRTNPIQGTETSSIIPISQISNSSVKGDGVGQSEDQHHAQWVSSQWDAWTTYIIHGCVEQSEIKCTERGPVKFLLIGRSSKNFAGARYLKRGVNSDGHVANHVEVEQIVYDIASLTHSNLRGKFSSFVQIRGSVPVVWYHPPVTRPKPPILIGHNTSEYTDTRRHFEELIEDFGVPIVVVNLLKAGEQKGREVVLSMEYRKALTTLFQTVRSGRASAALGRVSDGSSGSQFLLGKEICNVNSDTPVKPQLLCYETDPIKNAEYVNSCVGYFNRRFCRPLGTESCPSCNYARIFDYNVSNLAIGGVFRNCQCQNEKILSNAKEFVYHHANNDSKDAGGEVLPPEYRACNYTATKSISTYDDGKPLNAPQSAVRSKGVRKYVQAPTSFLHDESVLPSSIVQYLEFDFRNFSNYAWNIMTAIAEARMPQLGIFSSDDKGYVYSLQCGVMRSNCVDCIDRTNLGQYFLGLYALSIQLHAIGVLEDSCDITLSKTDLQDSILKSYLCLGDAIAIQYGGSAQVGAGLLDRGIGWDKIMGVRRLYSNLVMDKDKQHVVNLFLGLYSLARRIRVSNLSSYVLMLAETGGPRRNSLDDKAISKAPEGSNDTVNVCGVTGFPVYYYCFGCGIEASLVMICIDGSESEAIINTSTDLSLKYNADKYHSVVPGQNQQIGPSFTHQYRCQICGYPLTIAPQHLVESHIRRKQPTNIPPYKRINRNIIGKYISETENSERVIDIHNLESDYYLHVPWAAEVPEDTPPLWWLAPLKLFHERRDPYFYHNMNNCEKNGGYLYNPSQIYSASRKGGKEASVKEENVKVNYSFEEEHSNDTNSTITSVGCCDEEHCPRRIYHVRSNIINQPGLSINPNINLHDGSEVNEDGNAFSLGGKEKENLKSKGVDYERSTVVSSTEGEINIDLGNGNIITQNYPTETDTSVIVSQEAISRNNNNTNNTSNKSINSNISSNMLTIMAPSLVGSMIGKVAVQSLCRVGMVLGVSPTKPLASNSSVFHPPYHTLSNCTIISTCVNNTTYDETMNSHRAPIIDRTPIYRFTDTDAILVPDHSFINQKEQNFSFSDYGNEVEFSQYLWEQRRYRSIVFEENNRSPYLITPDAGSRFHDLPSYLSGGLRMAFSGINIAQPLWSSVHVCQRMPPEHIKLYASSILHCGSPVDWTSAILVRVLKELDQDIPETVLDAILITSQDGMSFLAPTHFLSQAISQVVNRPGTVLGEFQSKDNIPKEHVECFIHNVCRILNEVHRSVTSIGTIEKYITSGEQTAIDIERMLASDAEWGPSYCVSDGVITREYMFEDLRHPMKAPPTAYLNKERKRPPFLVRGRYSSPANTTVNRTPSYLYTSINDCEIVPFLDHPLNQQNWDHDFDGQLRSPTRQTICSVDSVSNNNKKIIDDSISSISNEEVNTIVQSLPCNTLIKSVNTDCDVMSVPRSPKSCVYAVENNEFFNQHNVSYFDDDIRDIPPFWVYSRETKGYGCSGDDLNINHNNINNTTSECLQPPPLSLNTVEEVLMFSKTTTVSLPRITCDSLQRYFTSRLTSLTIEHTLVRFNALLSCPISGIPLSNHIRYTEGEEVRVIPHPVLIRQVFTIPTFVTYIEQHSDRLGLTINRIRCRYMRIRWCRELLALLTAGSIVVRCAITNINRTGICATRTTPRDLLDDSALFTLTSALPIKILNNNSAVKNGEGIGTEGDVGTGACWPRSVDGLKPKTIGILAVALSECIAGMTLSSFAMVDEKRHRDFTEGRRDGMMKVADVLSTHALSCLSNGNFSLAEPLSAVDISCLGIEERICFFINIFNALYIQSLIIISVENTYIDIVTLYQTLKYNIGGHFYSLADIKYGILRGNQPSPLHVLPQFLLDDSRKVLSVRYCKETYKLAFAMIDTYITNERSFLDVRTGYCAVMENVRKYGVEHLITPVQTGVHTGRRTHTSHINSNEDVIGSVDPWGQSKSCDNNNDTPHNCGLSSDSFVTLQSDEFKVKDAQRFDIDVKSPVESAVSVGSDEGGTHSSSSSDDHISDDGNTGEIERERRKTLPRSSKRPKHDSTKSFFSNLIFKEVPGRNDDKVIHISDVNTSCHTQTLLEDRLQRSAYIIDPQLLLLDKKKKKFEKRGKIIDVDHVPQPHYHHGALQNKGRLYSSTATNAINNHTNNLTYIKKEYDEVDRGCSLATEINEPPLLKHTRHTRDKGSAAKLWLQHTFHYSNQHQSSLQGWLMKRKSANEAPIHCCEVMRPASLYRDLDKLESTYYIAVLQRQIEVLNSNDVANINTEAAGAVHHTSGQIGRLETVESFTSHGVRDNIPCSSRPQSPQSPLVTGRSEVPSHMHHQQRHNHIDPLGDWRGNTVAVMETLRYPREFIQMSHEAGTGSVEDIYNRALRAARRVQQQEMEMSYKK